MTGDPDGDTLITLATDTYDSEAPEDALVPAWAIAWSRLEPDRLGEVFLIGDARDTYVLGRHAPDNADSPERLVATRQRPGSNRGTGQLRSQLLSRNQLEVRVLGDGRLAVRNLGRRSLLVNGKPCERAEVSPGDVIEIKSALVMLHIRRPAVMPGSIGEHDHRFGHADRHGLVGESPAIWSLRERLAFGARRHVHVLLRGPSGTGKELVAAAIHALSPRAERALVSRNAATFPAALIDAELFGNARNYPNPGMPGREGLIGAAHDGSLFLDEIGELSHDLQAHLLRVLDRGEYQRLGENRTRRADVRFIAATNRAESELKHDFLARFAFRLELTGLDRRREDIPLLARRLLQRIAAEDPEVGRRFLADGEPRIGATLIRDLLNHPYTTHVRELEALLWQAILSSPKDVVVSPPGLADRAEDDRAEDGTVKPGQLTREQVQACLERCDGSRERAWRALGLRNRFQLNRLLKKYGLAERSKSET